MASLKPWYKVVTPREDLREGKPLDASEFAVHLDQVRDGRAPTDYQNPERFFERTYLTNNLTGLAAEVIRRLSGEKTETSAVFNMSTQFGGGKTHALTLLYHLAKHGPNANGWAGVRRLLDKSGFPTVPNAALAVFVGTEFDSITGRGGNDGTPLRKTPWGEIAFQLGGAEAFAVVAEHEKQLTAPAGEVIRRFLPKGQPCLILLDELMNYVSRSRKSGLATQLYSFLHNLSEEARGQNNVVLAVSIPASELEMSAEDQSDYERFKKLLDRVGKAVIMSAEAEASEIIRRRLFEWWGLPDEARKALAWEDIKDEDETRLDEAQKRQLAENLKKAQRDLKEAVWRTYKNVVLLGKDNKLRPVDLGLVHSSAADSMITLVTNRLRQDGDVEAGVSPTFLVRNWPPAFKEWSTKNVRDAFFASPQFPRLLNGDAVKDTIARGVSSGLLAYVGKTGSGAYDPFIFTRPIAAGDVEVSEDVFIISKDAADAYEKAKTTAAVSTPSQTQPVATPTATVGPSSTSMTQPSLIPAGPWPDSPSSAGVPSASSGTTKLAWTGEVPAQKWMNFYTKVLAKFAAGKGLKLTVNIEAAPEGGVSTQKVEETKVSLRELGLSDDVKTS